MREVEETSAISGARSKRWCQQWGLQWTYSVLVLVVTLLLLAGAERAIAGTAEEAINEIATSLGAQATEKNTTNLAVVGFSEINGYQSAMTDYLAEELTTALFSAGDFSIVERSQLARVMNEHQLYTTDLFDPEHTAELQKLLGVDAVVTGTVTRMGKQLRVNARVIDVTTARIFGAAATTIENDPRISSLLGQSSSANRSSVEIPGQVQQPSDVVFQSKYFAVTPISVVRSDDGSSVKVTAEVRNTSNTPIYVAAGGHRQRNAMTHAGTLLSVGTPSGMDTLNGLYDPPETEVLPNSPLIIQWVATVATRGSSMLGDSMTIRDEWKVKTENGIETIQVQFSKIMIN